MLSALKHMFCTSTIRHRRGVSRQFRLEGLESRTLLTLNAINFGATIASTPVVMNGELFFAASDPVHGTQLWESNGTSSGTTRITDGNDAYYGIHPQDLTVVGNTLYFAADDLTHGGQLWKSDGTVSGTTYVTSSNDGIANLGIYPTEMTNVNGTLYFVGYDVNDGSQLFTSNGTAAGTTVVADIHGAGGYPGSYPNDLTAGGGLLYFSATDSTHGTQLWVTNPSKSTTTMLTNVTGSSDPQFLTAVGSTVYFTGYDPTNRSQLWASNGTSSGTERLTSGGATGLGLNPQFLTAVGSTVYFSASDGKDGTQLWSFTGTTPGPATMLSDVNASGGGLSPTDLTAAGSTVFFAGNDGVHGDQLWSSTGTATGTAMVLDINGTSTADVTDLINMNGLLYFAAYTTKTGFQVWQSDGTAAGTVMDTQLNIGTTLPFNFMVGGSDLYFTAPGATMWQWVPGSTKTTPTITWANPASIVYGTALSGTQLDATANVAGTFTYNPVAGTVMGAGNGQTLSVLFVPTDTNDYTDATATTTINVAQATPTLTWATPASIVYGTALSSTQLDASANVAGTFTYNPAAGTVLKAGNGQSLSVSFAPTDTTDYKSTSATATINVTQATPTITWATPASIIYGTALSSTQLDASANVAGTFTYNPAAGTVLKAGNGQSLSVSFAPTDTTDYKSTSATATINVAQATPTITWATPASIVYGTALSSTQLDASANVAGTFTYIPAAGTVLKAGNGQSLSVSFAPTDTTDYKSTSATATINVTQATPTLTWATPASIIYGTALSSTQLDASANVAGTFTYNPAAGTVLKAGNGQTLSASFAPTDATDYKSTSATATINVAQATPTITWVTPASIVYGTALSSTQLDATANVAGTFTYNPAAGTVLKAANGQTLSVSFAPTDATDYTSASATATINVTQATPMITWANPANIVYGTALSGTQLDATANVAGTFTYSPTAGTVLPAGNGQTLSVSFAPTDTTDYQSTSATATINVAQATPTITWATPASIVYGTALSSTQLDATANVAGTFTYSPPTGTVLKAGNGQTLSASFAPTDATDYKSTSATATINVAQATPTITWATPASIVYGTALSSTQLDATANVAGTFTYNPAAGTVLKAANGQTLSVSFAPTDATDYTSASATATINVTQATPTITWANPANIVYGTALSGTQLDATANVAGTFTYSPTAGTVLPAGNGQTLSVSFAPTDSTDYQSTSATTTINVAQATPTITWANPASIVYGTALSSTQLDATANVTGTFTYNPTAGTVLPMGTGQTLSVSFAPTDATDYKSTSATATINVTGATPTITWANPADIVYGTALSSTQLDATANVAGTFTYNPAAGTVLEAGNVQTLSVSFAPTDVADYTSTSATATINVAQATPTLTWANPANIVYGTALSGTQLDATANVAGTFTYSPTAGTVLPAGNGQTLSVNFTPTDSTDYQGTSATATINVAQATPTITWANPASIVYGIALSSTQLDATANVAGTFTYNPTAGTVLPVGTGQTLSVSFAPTDATDYTSTSATATINVAQATPTITWANPADIVYGAALSSTQLDATANVTGTFTYNPTAGTVLPMGTGQTLSVSFAPTDATDYTSTSATATINVTGATPTITWANPANIVYGTALSSTQLDATANVAGTFTYSPTAGTVLPAGNGQTLSVSFAPTDTTDYTSTSATATINVAQATPTLTWANPADIVYGTALSSTQLDATANVTGTFTYNPAAGTVLSMGTGQTLSVSFAPTDATDYKSTSATATINVAQATPTITWANPADIVYGTALSSTQLDATANVTGTFTYNPAAGTVLSMGTGQTLSVSFAPTDATDYKSTSATATINVTGATSTITWANPANIVYGTALSSTQLDATANVAGTFTYSPPAGTVLPAGNGQTLSVSFVPTDTTDYQSTSATATINVAQATPTITWANPASIVYGTALSSTQLDATANVTGTFTYNPAAGTVLKAGNGQTLSVSFAPTDATDYTSTSATATINVAQATPTITWPNPASIVYGTALSSTQLDASVSVTTLSSTQLDASASIAGTFTYNPAAGTVLEAGNGQTLSVSFAPTDVTDYKSASATATINVTQATPTITWPTPASIVYGTALSSTQLDASANVAGTFTYSPPTGTILPLGTGQTLSVSFAPTDSTDYTSSSGTATINVTQATPTITWPTPASIVYGTALSSTQLDASAKVAGTFTYTPSVGTILGAGNGQTLSALFVPTDTTDYTVATTTATINVMQAAPTITWPNPASIIYGTTLSSAQLDASANVAGTFTYNPAAGTVPKAGNGQTLSANFVPTDSTDYQSTTATATINVTQATSTITWANPANIVYSTALSGTQLNAAANVAGTFTYNPAAGTVLKAGNGQTLSVNFTPTDSTDYQNTSATATINVTQATPTITWPNSASIVYGTALSSTQLDASANVAGTFTYTLAAGAVLRPGTGQALSVSFVPTDATDYQNTSSTATLNVTGATPTITWPTPASIVYGTALSSTQLDATANVAGTFTYNPAAGTVLKAGSGQTLSVGFVPNDTTDYTTATATATINVLSFGSTATFVKTDRTTQGTWMGTYGADGYNVVGATTNNPKYPSYATVTATGYSTYIWSANTTDVRGLQNPSGSGRIAAAWYSSTSFTVDVNLTDGNSHTIALYAADWDNHGRKEQIQITNASTGAVLDTETLSSFVNGAYEVWTVSGHVKITISTISGGNALLNGLFFGPASSIPAPTITWANPASIVYGTALSSAQLDASANVAGTFTYTTAAGTVLEAGNGQTLVVNFTPTDTADYQSTSAIATINVLQATPTITWANPASIVHGTALSSARLDATANVAGTFTYTPAAGTVLPVGTGQTLSLVFTPNDTTDYASVTASTTIKVTPDLTPTLINGHINLVYRRHNKKGKPIGKPVVEIVFGYNHALNAAAVYSAGKYGYQVVSTTEKKVHWKDHLVLHPAKILSVALNASDTSVSVLTNGTRKTFAQGGQIRVLTPALGTGTFIISPKASDIAPAAPVPYSG